jgi:WD40 repeat protein
MEARLVEANGPIQSIEYSADGSLLAVSAAGFSVWDVSSGEKRYDLPTAEGPVKGDVACEKILDLDDQGRIWAIVFARGAHPVERWLVRFASDGKTWEILISNLHSEGLVQAGSAVLSHDGRQLAVLSQTATSGQFETILVWDVATGTAKRLGGHEEHVGCMAFSPDGTKLASVSQVGGPLKIWKLPVAKERPRGK